MSLIQQIKDQNLRARKDRDHTKKTLLTTLIGEAEVIGKNDGNRETTNDEVLNVIRKFIKNATETEKAMANRGDDTSVISTEIKILSEYLPKQLTTEELTSVISSIADHIGASSLRDMGSIMKSLKEQYSGTYDGKLASRLVKTELQKRCS